MAKAKKKKNNVMDLLGKQAKKSPNKPKKDALPLLEVEDNEKNRKLIHNWVENKKKESDAATLRKKAEKSLKPLVTTLRADYCLENEYTKSVKFKVGDEGTTITAAFQRKCSKISTENEVKLKKIFGDDYDELFRKQTNISLTDEAMEQIQKKAEAGQDTILDKLIEAMGGPEKFFSAFSVEQSVVPRDKFYEKYVTDPAINRKAKKAIEDEKILSPQGPSLSLSS